jgi:hypothetical protein
MEVINVKKENLKKLGYRDLEHWLEDPTHTYIGRNMSAYVKGTKGSKWQNPFKISLYNREQCLDLYEQHIEGNNVLYDSLEELDGKVLGCWCKPDGCHGDILIKLLNEKKRSKVM